MLRINKLTKTLVFPIATGAAAIGVLAGSVLTATSASAAALRWSQFKSGTALVEGGTTVKYVDIGTQDDVIRDDDSVRLLQPSANQFVFTFAPDAFGTDFNFPAAFKYTIEATAPNKFTNVQLNSNVGVSYGNIITSLAENSQTLDSVNGWPVPGGGGFLPINGSPLAKLTVTNELIPTGGVGLLVSLSNVYLQRDTSQPVPEPGTILGLLTVGGLGLVSRFKKQK